MDDHPNDNYNQDQLSEELPDLLSMTESPPLVEDAGIEHITPPGERASKGHIHPSEPQHRLEGVPGSSSGQYYWTRQPVHAPPFTPHPELAISDQASDDAMWWEPTPQEEGVPGKKDTGEEWQEYDPRLWESGNGEHEEQPRSATNPHRLEEEFPLLENTRVSKGLTRTSIHFKRNISVDHASTEQKHMKPTTQKYLRS